MGLPRTLLAGVRRLLGLLPGVRWLLLRRRLLARVRSLGLLGLLAWVLGLLGRVGLLAGIGRLLAGIGRLLAGIGRLLVRVWWLLAVRIRVWLLHLLTPSNKAKGEKKKKQNPKRRKKRDWKSKRKTKQHFRFFSDR